MSANNGIFINKKTFEIYEHLCMDNDFKEEDANYIGKGKNLEDVIEIVEKFEENNIVEYGIHFY